MSTKIMRLLPKVCALTMKISLAGVSEMARQVKVLNLNPSPNPRSEKGKPVPHSCLLTSTSGTHKKEDIVKERDGGVKNKRGSVASMAEISIFMHTSFTKDLF